MYDKSGRFIRVGEFFKNPSNNALKKVYKMIYDEFEKRMDVETALQKIIEKPLCDKLKLLDFVELIEYVLMYAPEELDKIVNNSQLMNSLPSREAKKLMDEFVKQGGVILPEVPVVGSAIERVADAIKKQICIIM